MKRSLVTFLLITVFFGGLSSVSAQVVYIAHRGASYFAPENTLASEKKAFKLDADAVECDIQLSKDKRLMVIHDSNTKRVAGKDFKISETDSKELRKLDVGSFKSKKFKGEKIPFLEETLDNLPKGKNLVVELKSKTETVPYLKEVVLKSGKIEQLIFIAFDYATILEVKNTFPENKCYWLCGNKGSLLSKIEDVAGHRLDGVDLNSSIIDAELVSQLKKLDLDIVAYTVDDPAEAKRLIGLGVNKITTNRPAWLKSELEKGNK